MTEGEAGSHFRDNTKSRRRPSVNSLRTSHAFHRAHRRGQRALPAACQDDATAAVQGVFELSIPTQAIGMKRPCRGSSLIESLAAMSVFAIGSAASGAWFAASIGRDAQASRTMVATSAVLDLRERMYANPMGVQAGSYSNTSPSPSPSPGECAAGCDAAGLAADDLGRFRQTLRIGIGASVADAWHCDDASRCHVRVTWRGRELVAAAVLP